MNGERESNNMKYLNKTLIFIFTVSFLSAGISAQVAQKVREDNTFDNKKCSLSDNYENFDEIEFKDFTLCIPRELKKEKVLKCIDGGCNTFESEEMILDIDLSPDAGIPVLERTYLTYQEEHIQISNKKVWLWSFEQDYKYKYIFGANFHSGNNKYSDLGLVVVYKDSNQKDIVKKIIKSVIFK